MDTEKEVYKLILHELDKAIDDYSVNIPDDFDTKIIAQEIVDAISPFLKE